eukprot:3175985-Pyramimonas_sp.AAC.1
MYAGVGAQLARLPEATRFMYHQAEHLAYLVRLRILQSQTEVLKAEELERAQSGLRREKKGSRRLPACPLCVCYVQFSAFTVC